MTTHTFPFAPTRVYNDAVPAIFDSRYLSGAAPLTSTTKAGLVMAAHADDLDFLQASQPKDLGVVWSHIASWHRRKYVRAVRYGQPRQLAQSQGFTWSRKFGESVARIWYGQHMAQRLAREAGRAVLHPVSGAHHAHFDQGGGFCTFNYVVAGLSDIQQRDPHARCAVIDLDAHWGDGTIDMIEQHNLPISVFDIHGGRSTERYKAGGGSVWDYGVQHRDDYWDALRHLPSFLATHDITDVVYLAGMDPFDGDPVGGVNGMTAPALFARDLFVLTLLEAYGISTVVNFAGGYVPDRVVQLHGGTIRAMQSAHLVSRVLDRGLLLDPAGAHDFAKASFAVVP